MQHSIMQLTEEHMSSMPEEWPVSLHSKSFTSLLGQQWPHCLFKSDASLPELARAYSAAVGQQANLPVQVQAAKWSQSFPYSFRQHTLCAQLRS